MVERQTIVPCDCIAKANVSLAALNTRVKQNIMLFPVLHDSGALVCTEKADIGKRGRPTTLMATFCPFCGVKYLKVEASDGDQG